MCVVLKSTYVDRENLPYFASNTARKTSDYLYSFVPFPPLFFLTYLYSSAP